MLLLLLIPAVFARFSISQLNVTLTIFQNGSAFVKEDYFLILTGEYDRQMYLLASVNSTIAKWQDATKLKDFRIHFNIDKVKISDVIIRPQPLVQSKYFSDKWHGRVIITYHLSPYFANGTVVPGTGVVLRKKIKPRTWVYRINPGAFAFPGPTPDALQLDKFTTLTIILPEGARLLDINPLPQRLTRDGRFVRALSWSGITLNQFTLVFEVEEPVAEEVVRFFAHLQQEMVEFLLSKEGEELVLLVVFLLFAFSYLASVTKKTG